MDFNDIQNAWNNEKTDNIIVPDNLSKIQSANMPLDKIRKNLRKELFGQILALLVIGFLPLHSEFPSRLTGPYYFIYGIIIAISIYYLAQLFLFYKRLDKAALTTKDSLYETYYDIRLNMQLYKTFTFVLAPFLMIYLAGYLFFKNHESIEILNGNFENGKLLVKVAILVITILLIGVFTEWWVSFYYGKYAREIKKVIDELKEEK
ncbi:hypothetical protein [Flavobacterium aquidurense]|uniref:Uncharacterized protein n=1 Tax=Flavobacterium aquidurense TaxID=362413 RepID=A0A0Q0RVH2_9FLAO|nr:hypothetical protein [Flavobacterium aquidurense]KQB41106.1 hypothetical protein RC62_4481 [Flavobacterium aquidurense]